MSKEDPLRGFEIDQEPEWTEESLEENGLLETYYNFNWEQVQETLAKLRRFRYIKPVDAREKLIGRLLPVLDSFERIFDLARDSGAMEKEELKNWLTSFEGVYKRLVKILSQEGVEPIDSVGQKVNLEEHEVVAVEEAPDKASGTVIGEQQKGYRISNRVLRDAKVVVAKNPENKTHVSNHQNSSAEKEES